MTTSPSVRGVRRYGPYRGAERNEHPNIPNTNRTEPNNPNIRAETRMCVRQTNVKQNDKTVLRDGKGRWLAGTPSPSPGRPVSSRQKISERLLQDLAEVRKLATIAYGLLPKDVFISVEQKTPGNLEPEAWAALRRVLDLIQAAGADGDLKTRAGYRTYWVHQGGIGSWGLSAVFASNV